MNGLTNRRATLTGGTPLELTFADSVQSVGLALMTEGAILAYKVNKTIAAVDEVDSNFLNDTIPAVNVYKGFQIRTIWVVSDVDCEIQWELQK